MTRTVLNRRRPSALAACLPLLLPTAGAGLASVALSAAPRVALAAPANPAVVQVEDVNDMMKNVAPPKAPAFPKIAKKPGTVRGMVLDGVGRPIARAQVAVHCSAGGGFRTTHKARSNAKGLYEVLLPVGIAEVVEANCTVAYNGTNYDLPLRPVAGEFEQFNAKDGHVEHLILQTSGEYGGAIRAQDNLNTGTVELTLTPEGPLLDGSAGRTFVCRYSADKSETFLNGLPLGRYRLTARLLDGNEALPLRVGNTFGSEAERAQGPSLQIDFKPGYTFSTANPGKSNKSIQRVEVWLEP